MAMRVGEVVRFRSDRLFNGAVSLDWFNTDTGLASRATDAFVFHGRQYHGLTQEDVGTDHGHVLTDTATFAREIVREVVTDSGQPFALAIAGYGAGKSHLALTLAALLADPTCEKSRDIVGRIAEVDSGAGKETGALLRELGAPCLVIALNGMESFDLVGEVTRQVLARLREKHLDTTPIEDLRPRFRQAATLVGLSNETILSELLECCAHDDRQGLLAALRSSDEVAYRAVHDFFTDRGMPIRSLGGESVKDVINETCRTYCGAGRPFSRLVVLFDEFGRYAEFATRHRQIAGAEVLQHLFEAIQANPAVATFVGFIQFELSAYVERMDPEYRNDILRVSSRFGAARKVYLSTNLETLLASLMEKRQPDVLDRWFDSPDGTKTSQEQAEQIKQWFPASDAFRLWREGGERFSRIVCKGAWPLSPFSSWFLFHLTVSGKHLQSRSALSLLSHALDRLDGYTLEPGAASALAPAQLWTEDLEHQLIASEEAGSGTMVHAYQSVLSKHGARLSPVEIHSLRAIALAAKMGLRVHSRGEAIQALACLAGTEQNALADAVVSLQTEHNVIEWDESTRLFEILGDAVPRTQFLAFLRQRVSSAYESRTKAELFVRQGAKLCTELCDRECDFGTQNQITTTEWSYQGMCSIPSQIQTHIGFAAQQWKEAVQVDAPRGRVIYCYLEPGRDVDGDAAYVRRMLRAAAQHVGQPALPILVVLLSDSDGELGNALAELVVMKDELTEEERARFGNLVSAHTEKTEERVRAMVQSLLKEKRYVTGLREEITDLRLSQAGTELFSRIYPKPVSFPFDGFSTARGNAAETCQWLTQELIRGKLDHDVYINRPAKEKNRADAVLNRAWGAITKAGGVSRSPSCAMVRHVVNAWDAQVKNEETRFLVGEALHDLCRPPYGANIASAGLLLGVFLAPRQANVMFSSAGETFDAEMWLKNGVFRGKYLDLDRLRDVEVVPVGEASAEWESLLDEWEQALGYQMQIECLERSNELRARVAVPPALRYRVVHCEESSRAAKKAIQEADDIEDAALRRIENGRQKGDAGLLSWGAAELKSLANRMTAESGRWASQELERLGRLVAEARQFVMQSFGEWLRRQVPMGGTSADVGAFRDRMLNKVGGNLKDLDLMDLYAELEQKTLEIVRRADLISEARTLIQEVSGWLGKSRVSLRLPRVGQLREISAAAKRFARQIGEKMKRVEMAELPSLYVELADFNLEVKQTEDKLVARAQALWKTRLARGDEIERLKVEAEELVQAYEGCSEDVEDLRIMCRALAEYEEARRRLSAPTLGWTEFSELKSRLARETVERFGDEEMPWDPEEVVEALAEEACQGRNRMAAEWLAAINSEVAGIETASPAALNQLQVRISSPPAVLAEEHLEKVSQIGQAIAKRQTDLGVDALVAQYEMLSEQAKALFLTRITNKG